VVAAVAALVGEQQQRPPAFSAKKVGGERSHRLARRGQNVELAPTQVTVYTMDLLGFEYPDLEFRTTVSAGTYVRALARDLGAGLGCGGHLTGLRRESIGQLRVESALAMDAITLETKLLPALAVVAHLARVDVSEADATNIGFGRAVELRADHASPASESPLALVHQERLIGIGRVDAGKLQPEVVLEAAG
jgi:tRNA pseudouridine55 synthase